MPLFQVTLEEVRAGMRQRMRDTVETARKEHADAAASLAAARQAHAAAEAAAEAAASAAKHAASREHDAWKRKKEEDEAAAKVGPLLLSC